MLEERSDPDETSSVPVSGIVRVAIKLLLQKVPGPVCLWFIKFGDDFGDGLGDGFGDGYGDILFYLLLEHGVKVVCLVMPPSKSKVIKHELLWWFNSGSPRHFRIKFRNFFLSNCGLRLLISSRYICLWILKVSEFSLFTFKALTRHCSNINLLISLLTAFYVAVKPEFMQSSRSASKVYFKTRYISW